MLQGVRRVWPSIRKRALHEAAAEIVNGEHEADHLHRVLAGLIATEPRVQLDYAEVVDAHDLTPVTEITGDVLVAVAATVGRARLIDNMMVSVGPQNVDVDLGASFEINRQMQARLAVTFGDADALGLSFVWTPRGLR